MGTDTTIEPEQPGTDWDETRATARVANVDIEVLHRRAWTGDAEQLQVTLHAVPSFDAVLPMMTTYNPVLMLMRLTQAAWTPWLSLVAPTPGPRPIEAAHEVSSTTRDPHRKRRATG